MADAKPRYQPGECDLGGIGHAAEHGFAEEGPAQLHAIKAADQPAVMPAFDRMGMTDGMKPKRGPFDRRVDPGFVAIGAGQQDLMKRPVAGDRESPGADASRQRTGHVEPVERDNRAAAGLDPENIAGLAAVGHGEYASGIAPQQHPRIQAFAHSLALTESGALPLAGGKVARPFRFRPEDAGSGSDVPSSRPKFHRR